MKQVVNVTFLFSSSLSPLPLFFFDIFSATIEEGVSYNFPFKYVLESPPLPLREYHTQKR